LIYYYIMVFKRREIEKKLSVYVVAESHSHNF
jgi:hypothetical protein